MSEPTVRSVRAPASSANLGAGFDVFGMAVTMFAEFGAGPAPEGATQLDDRHPGRIPFERLGGRGDLWFRTNIPMARGLGFSGAARVAAAGLGAVVAAEGDPSALDDASDAILDVAAELEGHGDNAAASLMGGVTAYVDGRVLQIPLGPVMRAAEVVAWVPRVTTSTDASRKTLAATVDRTDAVANLARVAQFTLAIAQDDPSLLIGSTEDHLHQPARLPAIPDAAEAVAAAVDAGAWCSWLSGSGPTVAMLCDGARADDVVAALPPSGHAKRLHIDTLGLVAFS